MKKITSTFLVMALLLIGCESEEHKTYYLYKELKSYIPFEGGEQIHYIINGTEQIVLSAQNPQFYFSPYVDGENETMTIVLADSTQHSSFGVQVMAGISPFISFTYNYNNPEDANNTFGLYYAYSIGNEFENARVLESFSVRNKTYYNVIELESGYETSKMYYCASDGVIKYDVIIPIWINDGNDQIYDTITYELDKIVWN